MRSGQPREKVKIYNEDVLDKIWTAKETEFQIKTHGDHWLKVGHESVWAKKGIG